jgi:protein-disulfide isomerase
MQWRPGVRSPKAVVVIVAVAIAGWLGMQTANAAEQFTPAQRAEIVRIVRDALREDPSILRDAVEALRAAEGKRAEDSRRTAIAMARPMLLTDPADPVGGNPVGDVTIVEFFDPRCPYCRRLEPTMAGLLEHDHGLRLVYKDLPVLGAASVLGSRALLAAFRQQDTVPQAYEKLRSALMRGGPDITNDRIKTEAERLGLDWPRLQQDMADPGVQRQLDGNLKLARSLGIDGTPALVIGDDLIPGAVELPDLQKAVADARAAR